MLESHCNSCYSSSDVIANTISFLCKVAMSEDLIMANLPDILDIDQFLGAGSYCWVYTCRYKPGCENSLCGIPASGNDTLYHCFLIQTYNPTFPFQIL